LLLFGLLFDLSALVSDDWRFKAIFE
jgi:hypothetical protein